jgi:hypothetical protein
MATGDKTQANDNPTKEGIEFVKVSEKKTDLRKEEPPLVDVKVANPVTYLKSWWKKIIGNEGMELRLKIKPLTAIAIAVIVVTVTLGIGRFVFPFKIPFFEYSSEFEPTPTPDSTRETAFTGTLRKISNDKYYLDTELSEAITLDVPEKVELAKLEGLRIFATGKYNTVTRILSVADIAGLEILSYSPSPIPTLTPSPSPSVFPSATPETASPSATGY